MSVHATRPTADVLRIVAQRDQISHDPLRERAARLWPESTELQDRWLRAVAMVRRTRRGWLLDTNQPRSQA